MQPQARDGQQPPGAQRDKDQFSPRASGEKHAMPDFILLASRTRQNKFLLFKGTQFVVISYGNHRI